MRSHAAAARAAALVAGGLAALAFPQAGLWWLGFVGLVPTLWLWRTAPSGREAAVRAWAAGTGFFMVAYHWLAPTAGGGLALLAGALAVLWIPSGLAAYALRTRPLGGMLVVPAAFVAGEYARSWDRLGGPWAVLGASQWSVRPVLQAAALGGVWLVSFLLVAVNAGLAAALGCGRKALPLGAAAAVAGAALVYGAVREIPPPERTLRVAGVQVGVIRAHEARFAAGERETLRLARRRTGGGSPDLVVWGESSVPFDLSRDSARTARLAAAARAAGAEVLVNTDARRGGGGIFKSSVLIGPQGPAGRYDKVRLVPFGEYIPLRGALGWLHRVSRAAEEDRRRGRGPVLLHAGGVRLGPLVCFESAFPDMTRRLVQMGAEVIVVQSATTTFQDSWAPAQHASLAALRAVEAGRPVVHATLSGVSAAFDATGRRLAWVGTERRGVWRADVPLEAASTPYVRYGDWVPWGSVGIVAWWVCGAALRRTR